MSGVQRGEGPIMELLDVADRYAAASPAARPQARADLAMAYARVEQLRAAGEVLAATGPLIVEVAQLGRAILAYDATVRALEADVAKAVARVGSQRAVVEAQVRDLSAQAGKLIDAALGVPLREATADEIQTQRRLLDRAMWLQGQASQILLTFLRA